MTGFHKEDETKQGPAIFLSLKGKACQEVRNIPPVLIKSKDGIKEIIKVIDKLYKRDKVQLGFETYDTFERFHRPADMSVNDYINEFESLLNKTTKFGTTIAEDILVSRLLKSAHLSEEQEQLVKVTIDKYKFEIMQEQLRQYMKTKGCPMTLVLKVILRSKTIPFIRRTLKEMLLVIEMKPIIKEDRANMVMKSAKILQAHLIEEEDIIKD